MGKLDLNFAGFGNEKMDELAAEEHPMESVSQGGGVLPTMPMGSVGLNPAGSATSLPMGSSSVMIIYSLVDRALAVISEISRCAAMVSMAKQQTKQVQAQAEAQIEASRQQTKQMRIQQTEETRRLAAQCKKEMAIKRIELQELRENLKSQNEKRRDRHQAIMASLDILGKNVDTLVLQSNSFCEMLRKGADAEERQYIMQSMDNVNSMLAQLSSDIVKLSQG